MDSILQRTLAIGFHLHKKLHVPRMGAKIEVNFKVIVDINQSISKQNKMVSLVEECGFLHRNISDSDTQIKSLVYELYGLSEEEVCMVEGE